MSDNKTFQSATPATLPANTKVATKEVTFSGDTTDVQLLEIVSVTGSEGSRTLNEISDASGLKIQDGGNSITVDAASLPLPSGAATAANQSTANTALDAIKTAVEIIDNFISGSKGLVTEDNSAAILTAVQTIDNFISGARGLVTEDNSASIKTAVEIIDNFISGSRGLVTEDNSAAALTALQLIDDVIATLGTTTYTEATTKGAVIGAVRRDADTTLVDTTNEIGPLQMNAAGQLKVEVFSGETLPVSLASVPSHAVTNAGTFAVQVDAAIPAGDNNIGNVDLASAIPAGTNNIGDVDVLSLPALPAGTNNIGDVDIASIAAGDNNIGNVDIVSLPALAAGTNAIGKLLPPDVDVTTHTNYAKKYLANTGAQTDAILWSPAAGKRWHVVSMYINVSAAATVTLEDDKAGGDEAVWKGELAANSGMTINFSELYPLASGEDAADLIVTNSAGNCYVTVTGYEI